MVEILLMFLIQMNKYYLVVTQVNNDNTTHILKVTLFTYQRADAEREVATVANDILGPTFLTRTIKITKLSKMLTNHNGLPVY